MKYLYYTCGLFFSAIMLFSCGSKNDDKIVDAPATNQMEVSISYLENMAAEHPEDDVILYKLSSYYLKKNDIENAYITIKRALEYGQHATYYFIFTKCLYEKGLYADALDYLQKVDSVAVPQLEYNNLATDVYIKNGKYSYAIRLMENLRINDPGNVRLLMQQAMVYAAIKDTAKAVEKYKEALAKDSSFTEAYLFLAGKDLQDNDFMGALQKMKQAVRYDTLNKQIYFIMAVSLKNLDEIRASVKMYEQCLSLDSNFYQAIYNLSIICLQQNSFTRAEKCLKKLKELQPVSPNVDFKLAFALYQQGRPDEALYYFERLDSLDINYNFAQSYIQKINNKRKRTAVVEQDSIN